MKPILDFEWACPPLENAEAMLEKVAKFCLKT